eukprot:5662633-Prymnesium_polylepis.1
MRHLYDRLHPGDGVAMRNLGLNLNAQMGFAKVQYEILQCPTLQVVAHGLTPLSQAALYYGEDLLSTEIDKADGCEDRTMMVGDGKLSGRIQATANQEGEATFMLPFVDDWDICEQIQFQVLDSATCISSRVGVGADSGKSIDGTAAALFPHYRHPPPFQASPPPSPLPLFPNPAPPPLPVLRMLPAYTHTPLPAPLPPP